MTAEIIDWSGETIIPIPADKVLEGAKAHGLASVLVVGRFDDGQLYLAASHSEVGDLMLLLARAKQRFLDMAETR